MAEQDIPDVDAETPAEPTFDAPASSPQPKEFDKAAAQRLMQRCIDDAAHNEARLERDKSDYLNLLYERGGPDNQYVIFDQGTNRYVTRGHDPKQGGLPAWMPRPVTPLYSNHIDGIVAQLNQAQPAQQWAPRTDDDEDVATAEACNTAIPVLLEEIDYPEALRGDINRQVTLTDKIAICLYYDNSERYGTEEMLAQQCLTCAEDPTAEESYYLPMDLPEDAPETCPSCGGPLTPAIDPQRGTPMGVSYPIGRMRATFHPSFEFSLPSSARTHRAKNLPWWLGHTRYSWEDFHKEWPGHTNLARDGSWATSSLQRQFADAMRALASPRSGRAVTGSSGAKTGDGPVVYHLLHDPIKDDEFDFPEGVSAWMANGQLLDAGPLDYVDTDGKPFKNVLVRTFRGTPGSPFGHPPADDMQPMQYTRNLLEALLLAITTRHASPSTWVPMSVTLEKPPTGVPGEINFYRSAVPGDHPVESQGLNPPEGLFKYIQYLDEGFDRISKLNAVLQGDRPSGDPTLGEVEILREQGQTSFSEPLLELVAFEKELSRMLLWIARDTVWTKRLRQVMGENGRFEVESFDAADLRGGVDVQIDPASAWPKTPRMKRLAVKEFMLELQGFTLLQMNPELGQKLLELYDLTDLLPSLDEDRRQIMRELDRWKAAVGPTEIKPFDPLLQNPRLHFFFKLGFLKTEEAEQLAVANPMLFAAMRMHVESIHMHMAMEAQAAAAAQAAAQAPGGQGEDGDGGATLDAAIEQGALQPADAGGTSLEAAVGAGALLPAEAASAAAQATGPSVDQLMELGAMAPAPGEDPATSMPSGGA